MAIGGALNLSLSSSFQARPRPGPRPSMKLGRGCRGGAVVGVRARLEKPLEELYNVRVERGALEERVAELGVSRWSTWKTGGKCRLPWDWHVDQQVYIVRGEVQVVPEGSKKAMRFAAGDLIRYPKWFEADLYFQGPYEERYRFRAYGED